MFNNRVSATLRLLSILSITLSLSIQAEAPDASNRVETGQASLESVDPNDAPLTDQTTSADAAAEPATNPSEATLAPGSDVATPLTPAKTPAAQNTPQQSSPQNPYVLDTPQSLVFLQQQIRSGESEVAQTQLKNIVSEIEAKYHRYHAELLVPLTLSGDAHMARKEYGPALEYYDRARHIARVSTGLFDPGQLPIVYREANAFRYVGDLENASQKEEYAYEVARKAFGNYHIKGLPALYRLADFYLYINQFVAARSLYNRALAIHATVQQDQTMAAIPALTGIAASHRLTRFPPYYVAANSEPGSLSGPVPGLTTTELDNHHLTFNDFPAGERALQQIIEIRRKEQPDDKEATINAILDLADWHLLFDRGNAARTLYTHVYETLVAESLSTTRFDTPQIIYFPTPEDPIAPDDYRQELNQQPTKGYVTLSFDVSPAGRVRKLKTIESVPDGLMEFRVRRSMRQAVYRPKLVDGLAAMASDHRYTYTFDYYPKGSDTKDSPAGEGSNTKDTVAKPGGETQPSSTEADALAANAEAQKTENSSPRRAKDG